MQELMTIASILGRVGQVITLQIHQPTPMIRATVAAVLERVPYAYREIPTSDHPTGVGYASMRVAANGYTVNFVIHGVSRPRGWQPMPVHTWMEHELLAGEYIRGGIVAQMLDDATRPESLQ